MVVVSQNTVFSPSRILLTLLLAAGLPLMSIAQQRLSFSLQDNDARNSRSSFHQALTKVNTPRGRDYLDYPFPVVETTEQRKQAAHDRYIRNLITNKNKNGFIGNLLGLQRIRPAKGAVPKF